MGEWRKTGCVLCAQNCGLEVLVEDNRIIRSRPDRSNPRSQGYSCRKGLNVAYHQHNADRLTHPLKRTANGFEPIGWDQAVTEIAERLGGIIKTHGPRSFAYMGGGGQGCHFEAAFGVRLLRALGSRYHYNALSQELTGLFWAIGRMFGRQYLFTEPDYEHTDLLLAVGWNGWMSHQMPQARRVLAEISKNPNKLLVVIDPRRSDTARRADIHLAPRPGADALLFKAMIAMILKEGWQAREYIAAHADGFAEVVPWFEGFDIEAAIRVAGLDPDRVREVTHLVATRRSSAHPDLGVLMGRHSTITTYLLLLMLSLTGRIGVSGGNVFHGQVMPIGSHSDERNPKSWRTVTTGYGPIMNLFPCNVLPEEILSDHPERTRAVLVSGSNPLRSYADTTRFEQAFSRLDLLVTIEVAMTETAALSHYVLPARTGYESWDATFFPWTYPDVFFQMRRPVVEPQGEPLEAGEILVRLAEALGVVPEIPDTLKEAATKDRLTFGLALIDYFSKSTKAPELAPFVLARTLGPVLGSTHLAALWGLLMSAPKSFGRLAARAGFEKGPVQGEMIFQAVLDKPEGLWVGRMDPDNNLREGLQTETGRIVLHIPELDAGIRAITPEAEEAALAPREEYPFVLSAGRHMDTNANTLMRDPAWNAGRRACTLTMHPDDAAQLGLSDGDPVRVVTEAGSETAELEIDPFEQPGHLTLPHGFGLVYDGAKHGPNVNRLTSALNRDPIAGTPLHRFVPCRVVPPTPDNEV